jgi:hypothetical protein
VSFPQTTNDINQATGKEAAQVNPFPSRSDRAEGRSGRVRAGRLALAVAALALLFVIVPGADAESALQFEELAVENSKVDGTPSTQAGAHPSILATKLEFNTVLDSRVGIQVPAGGIRDTTVELPSGMLGNPNAIPKCPQVRLDTISAGCPTNTQIGIARLEISFVGGRQEYLSPVYNMVPPPGEPAQFGFTVVAANAHIDFSVRNDSDYGVTATLNNANAAVPIYAANIELFGVPGDPSNGPSLFLPAFNRPGSNPGEPANNPPLESENPELPFLRNPTSCPGPLNAAVGIESWEEPGAVTRGVAPMPATTGCAAVPFAPRVAVNPASREAGDSTGFGIDLKLPQSEDPDGLATSDLKKVVMTLPKGVAVNSSSADGLGSCSDAQFDKPKGSEIDHCPLSSKIGSVEVETPLLANPLEGSVFLGTPLAQSPQAAADGRMYRLFIEAEGSGVRVKLAGSVVPDPNTGQLVATFDDNPQLPFEKFHLQLNGGPRSPLATPKSCGTYTTQAQMYPWARPTEPVTVNSSFTIDEGCGNAGQFTPNLEAGTTAPNAGQPSPFTLRVTQPSGQSNLSTIQATLPQGVLAKLAGVQLCGDAEAASGNCPGGSQVGTTVVGAGLGSSPIYVPQPGRAPTAVYLAGPYKGAPYSLVVKVPAEAGPFNLGTVSVRNALFVDPTTTQVTAKSDPLPQILDGVPITYRDVRVDVNRNDFTVNPTSCEPMQVTSLLTSIEGKTATPSNRFQVEGCGGLGFKPSLKVQLKGSTKRTGLPGLKAVLTYPSKGAYANIARAQVNLPHSEFLEQGNLNKTCTKPVLLEGKCPKSTIYGKVKAWTPLLDQPLQGNLYLVGGYGYKLPALVAELNGQIRVLLVSKVDSGPNKGIRTTFEAVPDAPVSRFVLEMKGGKKYGLLVNSENVCKKPQKVKAAFTAQNGKPYAIEQKIGADCGKKHKGQKPKGKKKAKK